MTLLWPARSLGWVVAGAVALGLLQGCGEESASDDLTDPLGVCFDILSKETVDGLVSPDDLTGSADGEVNDLTRQWMRVDCHLADRTDPSVGVFATVESVPAQDARESITRTKNDSQADGNDCRALDGTDGVGEGVICFGDTGATGNDPGAEVSTLLGTRYYNVRVLRDPEKSWDLTRGEAIALVKEINENLTRELG